jgi:hypothetical protein
VQSQRRQLGDVNLEDLKFVERMIGERVRGVTGTLQIGFAEGLAVNDQHAIGGKIVEIGFERRRIHRDQYVGLVAGGENLAAGEV